MNIPALNEPALYMAGSIRFALSNGEAVARRPPTFWKAVTLLIKSGTAPPFCLRFLSFLLPPPTLVGVGCTPNKLITCKLIIPCDIKLFNFTKLRLIVSTIVSSLRSSGV